MSRLERITSLIENIKSREDASLLIDENKLMQELNQTENDESLSVKILSIFGGLAASSAFVSFLFAVRWVENAISSILLGIVFWLLSILLIEKYNKTILYTIIASMFFVGLLLLGIGLDKWHINDNLFYGCFMLIGVVSIILTQNSLLVFCSVLLVTGNVFALLLNNQYYQLVPFYTSIVAVLVTYFYLNESKIISISNKINKRYLSVLAALLVSYLVLLGSITIRQLFPVLLEYKFVVSIVHVCCILFVIFSIQKFLNFKPTKVIYFALGMLVIPSFFVPAVSGALLLILIGFYINHKATVVLGIITGIYFMAQFYYDLNYTLLTKSIALMLSGAIFCFAYFLIHHKQSSDEKH